MSLFSSVLQAPPDPILGLTEQYNANSSPDKVNLGVGVYQNAAGKVPLLHCVAEAERRLAAEPKPKGYLPIDGMPAYNTLVRDLVFGPDSPLVAEGRVVTVQALGGTGALKVGADLLGEVAHTSQLLISTPSWENHRALFTRAGFKLDSYRYYDVGAHGLDVAGMLDDLHDVESGTIVVLHACCHNPTGYDLTDDQWGEVIDVLARRRLVPFIDMAYQGFSRGVEEDNAVVRRIGERVDSFLVANSFSKSFSLYGERVGGLSIVCSDADEAARVLSQVKIMIRTNYSNPPTHGAALVSTVLSDADLRAQWLAELGQMRDRIKEMRAALVQGLRDAGVSQDMSHITQQVGMFSFTGLSRDQMIRLRSEHGVYGTDTGRICVAALNPGNIEHVSSSIAAVLKARAAA